MSIASEILNLRRDRSCSVSALIAAIEWASTSLPFENTVEDFRWLEGAVAEALDHMSHRE